MYYTPQIMLIQWLHAKHLEEEVFDEGKGLEKFIKGNNEITFDV